ncbi:DUF2280 domain-containing protein [Pseudomonas amygdali]|uniref:DUF2280 domain-containing protein n=1 Tax=Pseudomonas amygdali TaxID=47877 RepID=UPI0006B926CA|nr:DUF2280 domain-containing protein [Pseudomonas amygdali]KPB36769.1 Uncharacterized protein AC516_1394 [Pseudomonas amygdali pv. sesami]
MAALKHEVKSFIVQALACFDTPSQVVEQVKQEFGIEISRQQCESHDPTKRAGVNLAARWVTLFHDTRKRFREDTAEIPIANRAYRLRALGRIVEKAEGMRNLALALQVLEQAAKESGDMYVNRHRKDEPGDEPAIPTRIQVDVVDARKTDAQP